MTDPWRMQKSSELFTRGARLTWVQQTRPWRWSASPWLVKSNRHLPLQRSWDRQSVSSDISGDMSMIFNETFIYRYGFYQILFWVVESRQFLAQTNALLQVFFWDKWLVCFLAFWQPSILRMQSFVVASWIKRVPVTTPEKLWWKDVEGSVMIIRKANLSPNKTYLQDNTSYFISNYISDVIISDLSALKNWKPTQQAFHSAKFLRECLRRFTSSTPLQCHFSSIKKPCSEE